MHALLHARVAYRSSCKFGPMRSTRGSLSLCRTQTPRDHRGKESLRCGQAAYCTRVGHNLCSVIGINQILCWQITLGRCAKKRSVNCRQFVFPPRPGSPHLIETRTVFESYGAPEKRALQSNESQTHYFNIVRGDRSKVIPIRCCRRKANVIRDGEKCGAL